MKTEWPNRIEDYLWPGGESRDVWMIVDAARDRAVFRLLLECHLEYSCLYSGPLSPAMEIAAPYLVQLDYDYRDTHRFIRQGWGNSWGIFLRSDTSSKRLRRHLRRFLLVRDERGRRLVFRYYDPRVLRIYLPTCQPGELRTLFGPVESFYTEGDSRDTIYEFQLDRATLVHNRLLLALDAPPPSHRSKSDWNPLTQDADHQFNILTIRDTQMAAFSKAEVRKFEDWMFPHLRQFFLAQCQSLDEAKVRELIRHGMARAAIYGITIERDVCKYIDLMTVLGRDFDRDQRHAWANEILRLPDSPTARVNLLLRAAQRHLVR
jgi:hypothetical protein